MSKPELVIMFVGPLTAIAAAAMAASAITAGPGLVQAEPRAIVERAPSTTGEGGGVQSAHQRVTSPDEAQWLLAISSADTLMINGNAHSLI